ncbi:hypothetical protein BX600DRAFT_439305 [Xylariales sp. PMI_506]|nr:hypothetical protein BX600DRAFT_439305 [Xylariales sp. PMI_506]
MLSAIKIWVPVGLAILGATHSHAGAIHVAPIPHLNTSSCADSSSLWETFASSSKYSTKPYSSSAVKWTATSSSKTLESYHSTSPKSSSKSVPHHSSYPYTSITTTTVVSVVNTTYPVSVPHHTSYSPDCTTTSSTTPTIPPTTIYTTPSYTPVYTGCPTTCSVSAGTVELFFWPTDNTFTYPSTYVDTALDYTFTSPSVYMMINTIYGYNSAGRVGPSATSIIFALDLDEVSTIVTDSGATRQLTLNDLGTDCPTTADASVIATTIAGGPCDPILVAPTPVKSWASPCGACSNFGLFDPPYAIPTITGGVFATTTTEVETTTTSTSVSTTAVSVASTTSATTVVSTTSPTTVTSAISSTTVASPTSLQTGSAAQTACSMLYMVLSALSLIILL